jgi:hypothetical protein
MEKLTTFQTDNNLQRVTFIETIHVTTGVECDVYTFDEDTTKDLGIIRIEPGCKTPLQKVLKGNKTIEGYVSGRGRLIVTKPDDSKTEYNVNEQTQKPFEVVVAIGEKMQWQADNDSSLTAHELCFPPYQDGRFENLPE